MASNCLSGSINDKRITKMQNEDRHAGRGAPDALDHVLAGSSNLVPLARLDGWLIWPVTLQPTMASHAINRADGPSNGKIGRHGRNDENDWHPGREI